MTIHDLDSDFAEQARRANSARASAPNPARDVALRTLAARAVQTCRRWARVCSAPTPASCSITRHLRLPCTGGLPALARAAGVDRIEPGARSHFPSCFAPAVACALDFTAAIAA